MTLDVTITLHDIHITDNVAHVMKRTKTVSI